MDLNYNTVNIFPTPVHILDVKGFKDIKNDLIEYAYNLKKKQPDSILRSNYGGWQSSPFYVHDQTDKLHNFLINCLLTLPIIKWDHTQIYTTAWININSSKSFNRKHNHPTSDFSGVLWIKCPEKSGEIVFESPTCFQTFREIQSYTQDFKDQNRCDHSYWFPPTEGRLLIFPSHLEHEVAENRSNENRISVSFNIRLGLSEELTI